MTPGLPLLYHLSADYFMDVISLDRRDKTRETDSSARIERLAGSYEAAEEVRPDFHMGTILEQADGDAFVKLHGKFASTYFTQLRVLTKRSLLQVTRARLPLIIANVQVSTLPSPPPSPLPAYIFASLMALMACLMACLMAFLMAFFMACLMASLMASLMTCLMASPMASLWHALWHPLWHPL